MKWSDRKCNKVQRREGVKAGCSGKGIYGLKYLWEAKDWCDKRVCTMVAKTLETIQSTFVTCFCIPYVLFCEMYLSCDHCCKLMCICCILCLFVENLCVFVVMVFWICFNLMCICCISCVIDVSHVYLL